MKIRKITENDFYDIKYVSSIAFEYPLDLEPGKKTEEALQNIKDDPSCRNHMYNLECWAAFTDSGEVMSSSGFFPYPVYYNNHRILMNGVNCVVTLPQYRRMGAVRECFSAAFKEMYENNHMLSMLYPFNDVFYRKLGYEYSSRIKQWDIPLSALKRFNVGGSVESHIKDGDISGFRDVYDTVAKRYDLACIREDIDWKQLRDLNAAASVNYPYIWRNNEGIPKAYMIFKKQSSASSKAVINCIRNFDNLNEFQAVDAEGLKGILDFAGTFASHYSNIKLALPFDINIEAFINENSHVEISQTYNGMARIIDVKQVLELSAYISCGSIRIGVTDNMCPWNEGVWQVDFKDGCADNVTLTSKKADISVNINDFTRLILGAFSADELWLLPGVKYDCDLEILSKVFYKKKTWQCESY